MRFTIGRTMLGGVLALATLVVAPAAFAQQGQGSIAGRVTDKATGQPLASVQVTISAGTRGALSNADGRFVIENVTAGRVEVRARFIGFSVGYLSVTVVPGQTVTADFALSSNPVGLEAVVVTASGEQQTARQIPNAVTKIAAATVEKAPITNLTDLLNARAAGVTVMQSSGTTGGGTRVRVRGSNSVTLSNEPVYYIDGVRVGTDPSSNSIGVGGQVPSRLNDLNPEDIESIEVIKGPSAAALYGTAAANGIIQIRTKRGRPGPTQWTAYSEGGTVSNFTAFPDNVFGFDTTKSLSNPDSAPFRFGCSLPRVSLRQCSQNGGLFVQNPLMNRSPFRTGSLQHYGMGLSGGNEQTTFFVSSDFERENGVYNNNWLNRLNLRANIHNQVRKGLTVDANTGYVSSRLRLPDNDNNALGYLGSGLLGNASKTDGWGFLTPQEVNAIDSRQGIERFTGGLTANAQPFSWLSARAVLGLDFTNRFETRTIAPNTVFFNQNSIDGSRAADPVQVFNYTANFSGSARRQLSPTVSTNTTVGLQWFRERSVTIFASGRKLAAGTGSLAGIGVPSVSETQTEAKTLGFFVDEQVGLGDRLFVNAALRLDKNSAFGKNFGYIKYPKVGASWVISEEPFFPQTSLISSLRLRVAYGQSGLQPGVLDAQQFFTPTAVALAGTDVPAFTFGTGNLGNARLKPERTTEVELGLDADLLSERFHLELTYYDKHSHDALISVPIPPSAGGPTAQLYNLGQVNNKGVEITFTGSVLNTPATTWDFALAAFGNRNRLISLGKDLLGNKVQQIVFGDQRHVEGYPLGGYWEQRILGFADTGGRPGGGPDGIITANEIRLDPNYSYVGTPFPTQGASLSTGITWHNRIRVSALLDYRAGMSNFNLTAQFRCGLNECRDITDPKTPLAAQANAVASVFRADNIAYIEDADFLKLREIAVTYYAPATWAQRLGANSLSFTVSGRNLGTWTKYTGFDPELSQIGQSNFSQRDFLTQPPVRYFTARVNLTF
jgi:TonB-linked SusC/RagA family outer membrane protein